MYIRRVAEKLRTKVLTYNTHGNKTFTPYQWSTTTMTTYIQTVFDNKRQFDDVINSRQIRKIFRSCQDYQLKVRVGPLKVLAFRKEEGLSYFIKPIGPPPLPGGFFGALSDD